MNISVISKSFKRIIFLNNFLKMVLRIPHRNTLGSNTQKIYYLFFFLQFESGTKKGKEMKWSVRSPNVSSGTTG